MAFHGFQSSFTAGELSPSLAVRIDLARYHTGCSLLENMVVHPHGGASKRGGLRYLAALAGKTRLMPFIFSSAETYILAWSEKKLSFFTKEGQLLDGAGNPYVLTTPFSYETAKKMGFVQSADVVYLVSEDFAPYKLCRYAHDNWKLEAVNFSPKAAPPAGLGAWLYDVRTSSEKTSDGNGLKQWSFVITQINQAGEESLPSAVCSVEGPENLRQTCYPKLSWQQCAGAEEYRIYQEKNGKYGYIGSSLVPCFDAKNIAPDMTDCPPKAHNPFVNGNYPSCVCFHQQRLVFAGSKKRPQTLWFSRTGNFESFTRSSPVKADDAMEISIAGNEVSRISWLVSLRTLLVGTGGTEWEVKSNAGALTASDISLVPQSYRGSSRLPALIIGSSVLHINRTQREMHDLVYDFGTDSYSGSDHAVLAGHLFANRAITDWAYQQSPDSVIWCVRDDGALLGHTFLREHEVFAWHRHDTQGKFIAVCSLPGASADEVFFVVEREIGEQKHYFLERMEHNRQNTPQEDMSASSLFYVDCGLSYHAKENRDVPIRYVGGLEHLQGMEVAIIANGAVCPRQKVRTLSYEKNGETVQIAGIDIGYEAYDIVIGLPYAAKLKSMPVEAENGYANTLGKRKRIQGISVYFQNTNHAKIGTDFTRMNEVKWRRNEKPGQAVDLQTDYVFMHLTQHYENQNHVCIMSEAPLPLTVLALLPEVQVGG